MFRSLRSAYCTLRYASCSLLKIGIASVILLTQIDGTPLYAERTWEYESSFVTPEQALWRFGERLAIFSHCSKQDVHPRMLFGLGCMFVACCLEALPFGATQVAGACLMGYGVEQFVEGSLAKPICEWERRNFPN